MIFSGEQNDYVGSWLELHYGHYKVQKRVEGTYGQVWLMEASQAHIHPVAFAAKTFRIRESKSTPIDVRKLFDREIGLWVRMPPHFNVVMALGVDLIPISPQARKNFDAFPVVRMPLFDGTLQTWIRNPPAIDEPGTLGVIGQTCNGLNWLYSHGVSGHGDLKPENILYQDLRSRFRLEARGLPNNENNEMPWRVSVADLGWADAWKHMGLSERCWRPYLAPERQEPVFDGSRADAFAIGVIFTELLTGLHPAGKPTGEIARWKSDGWFKWAGDGRRELRAIKDDSLRSLVNDCLHPDPSRRPDPLTISELVSDYAEKKHEMPLRDWLGVLNKDAKEKEHLHFGWANEEIARIGRKLRYEAIDDLRKRLERISLSGSFEDKIEAVWLARSLAALLARSDKPKEWHEAYEILLCVGEMMLDEIDGHDWRQAIIYAPEGMSSREAAVEALHDVLAALRHLAGDNLPAIVEVRRRISQCER